MAADSDSKAFVDVGVRKPNTVYFNGKVFEIDDLLRLETPTTYLDVIFPSIFKQAWSLLQKGVRVYSLRDTRLLESLRQQSHVDKSDENDAKMLAIVPASAWKELTKDDITIRGLLHQYYVVADDIRRNKQWCSLMVDVDARALLIERINFLKRQRYVFERRILETAKTMLPYDYVSDRLGVRGVSLVTLMTYVDFSKTFKQLVMFAGFCDPKTRNDRFCRKVRRALNALAATTIRDKHQRYHGVYSYYVAKLGSPRKALLRLQKRLFKDIWQTLRLGPNHKHEGCERS